ncbi:unnamed protein product [Prunus armeniaca]
MEPAERQVPCRIKREASQKISHLVQTPRCWVNLPKTPSSIKLRLLPNPAPRFQLHSCRTRQLRFLPKLSSSYGFLSLLPTGKGPTNFPDNHQGHHRNYNRFHSTLAVRQGSCKRRKTPRRTKPNTATAA